MNIRIVHQMWGICIIWGDYRVVQGATVHSDGVVPQQSEFDVPFNISRV